MASAGSYDNPNNSRRSKDVLCDETSKACLGPDKLAARLAGVFFKKTGRGHGHVHFYFRNRSDHIILTWLEGRVDRILAKSANCEKGQYTHWANSEFSDYERKDVLKELHREIKSIEINEGFNKTWPSYDKFIKWLTKNV